MQGLNPMVIPASCCLRRRLCLCVLLLLLLVLLVVLLVRGQIYLMGLVNNPETNQGLKLWRGLDPSWEKMLRCVVVRLSGVYGGFC